MVRECFHLTSLLRIRSKLILEKRFLQHGRLPVSMPSKLSAVSSFFSPVAINVVCTEIKIHAGMVYDWKEKAEILY